MKSRQAGRQMMMTHSPLARAIEELLTERQNLAARLAKVDAAITTLRDLFHLPATGRPAKAAKASTNGNGSNGHSELSTEAIRAALKAGPLSPGDLATQLGMDRAKVRYRVAQLETDGVVVSTGVTANRRSALAGKPAKEAP